MRQVAGGRVGLVLLAVSGFLLHSSARPAAAQAWAFAPTGVGADPAVEQDDPASAPARARGAVAPGDPALMALLLYRGKSSDEDSVFDLLDRFRRFQPRLDVSDWLGLQGQSVAFVLAYRESDEGGRGVYLDWRIPPAPRSAVPRIHVTLGYLPH